LILFVQIFLFWLGRQLLVPNRINNAEECGEGEEAMGIRKSFAREFGGGCSAEGLGSGANCRRHFVVVVLFLGFIFMFHIHHFRHEVQEWQQSIAGREHKAIQ
jgi:hypothetical protein